jgi:hypothetical protein
MHCDMGWWRGKIRGAIQTHPKLALTAFRSALLSAQGTSFTSAPIAFSLMLDW